MNNLAIIQNLGGGRVSPPPPPVIDLASNDIDDESSKKLKGIPGKKNWNKSDNDNLRYDTVSLLHSMGTHKATKGNYTGAWGDFCDVWFNGRINANGEREEGIMSNYKEWTSDNAPVTKAKPLIMGGVEADFILHEQAKNMDVQPTPLQEVSYLVKTEAERAQKAADAKKEAENERAAKRLKDNHTEERRMNLRDEVGDNHRVSIPTLSTTQPAVATAVQQLSRQPGSVATASRNSRAQEEQAMAASAAVGAGTISYAPGQKTKTPKHVDTYSRLDAMAESAEKEATSMASTLKSITDNITASSAESPSKKKHRQFQEISANIKAVLEEMKTLKEMGRSTDEQEKQYDDLIKERNALTTPSPSSVANLGSAFEQADDA